VTSNLPLVRYGSIGQLRNVRAVWRHMMTTAEAMASIGLTGAQALKEEAIRVGAMDFYVPIPCLTCRQTFLEPVKVSAADNAEPASCICSQCSDRIDAELEELQEPKE
jgi:hypothetical protein